MPRLRQSRLLQVLLVQGLLPRGVLPRGVLLGGLLLGGLVLPGAAPLAQPAATGQPPTGQPPAGQPQAEPGDAPEAPVMVTGLRLEIVERGIYTTSSGTIRQMPNGIGENLVDEVELERSTTAIPARPGVSFGFEFLVHGRPAGTPMELTTTVVFPPPGLTPPGASQPVTASTTPMVVEVGAPGAVYRGYTFDYEWEVAPGPWRFEVRAGDRLLAVQSFIITSESSLRR